MMLNLMQQEVKKEIIFATNNNHKLSEVQQMIGSTIKVLSLSDINCFDEIPEERDTLEGNALQKAQFIYDRFQMPCFADDTGLEIDALNGEPGVYSARYSGNDKNITTEQRSLLNIEKALTLLLNKSNRNARFRTVIAYIENNKHYFFEGIVEGTINYSITGDKGFGYDSIFKPNEGNNLTFAQMNADEKNLISHRGRAINQFTKFLFAK